MPQRLKYGHSQTMMAKTAKTTEAVIALCMSSSSIFEELNHMKDS